MAVPTSARMVGAAAGTGVVVGAAQLGVAYGLGIVRWDVAFSDDAWHWQLTWLALLASVAVMAGAMAGRWYGTRLGRRDGLPLRMVATLASAVGSAVMIPLVLHPARVAHVPELGSPALTAVIGTSAGLLLGILSGFAVLAVPTVAGSMVTTVCWLWLAALASSAWSISHGSTWGSARPGLLPASGAWIPLSLLGAPALIAIGVATIARFGGAAAGTVAISGLAGPAVLALAYVIAAPGGGAQAASYRYALLAVAIATALSVLVAVARRPRRRSHPPADPDAALAQAGDARPEPGTAGAEQRPAGAHRRTVWPREPDESTTTTEPRQPTPARAHGIDETTQHLPALTNGAVRATAKIPSGPRRGARSGPARSAGRDRKPAGQADPAPKPGTPPRTTQAAPTPGEEPALTPGEQAAPTPGVAAGAQVPGPQKPGKQKPGQQPATRGRRRGRGAAGQPSAGGDSDYVDWVRALGGNTTTQGNGDA